MSKEIIEKRESKRAFFTLEDGISATVESADQTKPPISVILLSISRGGLSFMGARQKLVGLNEGKRLIVRDIQAPPPLGHIERVEVEIRYVLDLDMNVRVSMGCQFKKITENEQQRIQEYVAHRLNLMGLEDKTIDV